MILHALSTGKRLAALGRVVLFCVGCAVILMAASRYTPKLPGQWTMVVLEGGAGVATLGLSFLFAGRARIGVEPDRGSLARLVFGAVLGLLMVGMQTLLLGSLGHIRWERQAGVGFGTLGVAALGFLMVGLREEIAFRGYPLRRLENAFGGWVALAIMAVFFAIEHVAGGMGWKQALWGPLVGGIVFGLAALGTRGLALPIGMHAAWDFAQWILGFRDGSGIWQVVVDAGFERRVEQVATGSYLVVMGSAILGFLLYGQTREGES